MTFREAYDQLKAILQADSWITANGVEVIDGIQARMSIEDVAKVFETIFADNAYTVVIEHPGTAIMDDSERSAHLTTTFSILLVENPQLRESAAIDPLEASYEIANAVFGQPVVSLGRNRFTPAPKFYQYVGTARGHLFHQYDFAITTNLVPRSLPGHARPVAV